MARPIAPMASGSSAGGTYASRAEASVAPYMTNSRRGPTAASTARVLGPHGYRTGDLARCDAAGRLWLVGRARDLLKVGGHRVSAKEIEDTILEHPAVHECAVIGVPDELLGDKLRAFVVACVPGQLDVAALGGFLKERLPAYKIPSQIELRDDLPKNSSGKLMKEALRAEP